MTITPKTLVLGASVALAATSGAALAADRAQLAASAGVSPAEASQMTLTEIGAMKFNRDSSGDDRQTVRIEPGRTGGSPGQLRAAAGIEPGEVAEDDLTEIAALHFNRSSDPDDRQTVRTGDGGVAMSARQITGTLSPGARQLALNAGLSEEEAHGMSLRQIAAHFFNRSASGDDAQPTQLR